MIEKLVHAPLGRSDGRGWDGGCGRLLLLLLLLIVALGLMLLLARQKLCWGLQECSTL